MNQNNRQKVKIAFLLLGGDEVGGADVRSARLYNYARTKNEFDFYFFINYEKYENLNKLKILDVNSDSNIYLIGNENSKINYVKSESTDSFKKYIPFFLKYLKRWFKMWTGFYKHLKITSSLIKKYDIDVLYCLYLGAFLSPSLKRKTGAKIIVAQMDSTFQYLSKNFFKACNSYYSALKNADKVDCLGDYYKNGLIKFGLDISNSNKYNVAPCSFTDNAGNSVKEKKKIITFASRLTKFKNPILFLQVCKIISSARNDVRFRLLGSGELENEIKDFIDLNNLNKVLEFKHSYNLQEDLSDSIIFMSLQKDENYPSQSILEACICENMIVATDVGDTNKLVKEPFGFLTTFNPVDIARICLKILDNFENGIFYGKEARDFVLKNHSIEKYYDYFVNLIQNDAA